MKFEVRSVGYNCDTKVMSDYKEKLLNVGIKVCDFVCPTDNNCCPIITIIVDISSPEDFVKLVGAVGTIIFDGDVIEIYDDYYE